MTELKRNGPEGGSENLRAVPAAWHLFGIDMSRASVVAGILFTLTALLQLYGGAVVDAFALPAWVRIILAEILLIGLPPLLLVKFAGLDFRSTFRLRPLRPGIAGILLFITPVATIAAIAAGVLALFIIRLTFGRIDIGSGIEGLMDNGFLAAVAAVALSPAICEELMFRGAIMNGLQTKSAFQTVFWTGLLFGMFHFDFQRLAAQTLLGWVISYAVLRTGSLYAGMLIHFLHNGMSVALASIQSDDMPAALLRIGTLSADAVPGGDIFSLPAFQNLSRQYGLSLEELLARMIDGSAIALAFCSICLFGLMILLHYATRRDQEFLPAVSLDRAETGADASWNELSDATFDGILNVTNAPDAPDAPAAADAEAFSHAPEEAGACNAAAASSAKNVPPLSELRRIRRPAPSRLGLAFGAPGLTLILWVYTAIAFELSGSDTGKWMMSLLGL